jgi:hypothetical protein
MNSRSLEPWARGQCRAFHLGSYSGDDRSANASGIGKSSQLQNGSSKAGVPQQLGRDDALEVDVRAVEQEEKPRQVYLERPVRAAREPVQ